MTAKEMFEKLGYVQDINDGNFISYYRQPKKGCDERITFDKTDGGFVVFSPSELDDFEDCSLYIFPKELQAINKQVEELGWNK